MPPTLTTPTPAITPLRFTPIVFEKVWGGRRLARFGKPCPPGKNIGEVWEVADMAATSAGGAGGGSARSVVSQGPMSGKTLGEVAATWGLALLGRARTMPGGAFPLLIKFLDARENLSVQTHPSPAFAAAHPEAHLKTECWYILEAEPGAVIYKGLKPGVTSAAFAAHIKDGTVVSDLIAVPARPGECHNLPSGTCHALGAGVLACEVQTPSDTTYRIHDWGRTGRELHIDLALRNIDFGPAPEATSLPPDKNRARLVTTDFFTLDEARADRGGTITLHADNLPVAVTLIAGAGELRHAAAAFDPVPLRRGDTALIPAAIAHATTLHASESARALLATAL